MERPLVVVVDDDPANAWGLSLVLQDWGYRTVVGTSYEPVAEEIEARGLTPAAAICDYDLSGRETGVDVARALVRRCRAPIPVVIVTGTAEQAARRQASPYRFAVLTKPVDPDVLQTYLPAA